MSMEMQAWHSLYQAMHARDETRPFSAATLRRIVGFARPHRRRLAVFLVLSVSGPCWRSRHRYWPAGWSTRSSRAGRPAESIG